MNLDICRREDECCEQESRNQRDHMTGLQRAGRIIDFMLRLQQTVQNPRSNNTNVLCNSPSLGQNYSYLLKWKNRVKLSSYFWYSPLSVMRQKIAKNQWSCILLNFNQIKASLFQYKFKSIFPTKST